MRRHPRWVITNHNRRKHGLGRFLCGLCDYKGRFGHELINHMAEDHAADDPIVKCPCCQLELNFGRDAKLFDDHYRDGFTSRAYLICVRIWAGCHQIWPYLQLNFGQIHQT